MPDARERTETGKEPKERGRHAQAEGRSLPLPDELTAGELIAEHKGARARCVQNSHARLQLPGAREKRRQIDARVPFDARLECLAVQDFSATPDAVSRQVEFLALIVPDVTHADAVPPIPAPNAQRRTDGHGRMAIVAKEVKRVGEGAIAGNEERAARDVELLIVRKAESRRPGHPRSDVD